MARQIAIEIDRAAELDMSFDEVTSAVLAVVSIGNRPVSEGDFRESFSLGYEGDCTALGYFDDRGSYVPCRHYGYPGPRHPTGDDVQVRRVNGPVEGPKFSMVVDFEDGERRETQAESHCHTYGGAVDDICNFWVHVACWSYLQAWLNCALPPRLGRHSRPLSLAGELYEVVASRYQRQRPFKGQRLASVHRLRRYA